MASEGTTSDPITWQEKLEVIVDMMQDMSRQTDPQAMVRSYGEKIQQLLADRGLHRAPSIPDLLIAATAELTGLTVLHLDKDFELIASWSGQPTERLSVSPK
jgi:predicted nucleic acid-binding protein